MKGMIWLAFGWLAGVWTGLVALTAHITDGLLGRLGTPAVLRRAQQT